MVEGITAVLDMSATQRHRNVHETYGVAVFIWVWTQNPGDGQCQVGRGAIEDICGHRLGDRAADSGIRRYKTGRDA